MFIVRIGKSYAVDFHKVKEIYFSTPDEPESSTITIVFHDNTTTELDMETAERAKSEFNRVLGLVSLPGYYDEPASPCLGDYDEKEYEDPMGLDF